jgi:hypothetical protein
MNWTLENVRDLDLDEYDALIGWLQDQDDQANNRDGSIDADKLIEATRAKRAKQATDAH